MGWHPTIFSTLCCITSKLALHGNKLSPKANKTFPHSTISWFFLTQDSTILNTNLLLLHQFLNINGMIHRHKTGFLITSVLHAALNLGQDAILAEPQFTIYLSHFHIRKLSFLWCKLKGTVSSSFSSNHCLETFFNRPCIFPKMPSKWTI